jgi:flagellin-like protein
MKWIWHRGFSATFATLLAVAVTVTACKDNKPSSQPPPIVAEQPPTLHLTNAQPRLQTMRLFVGPEELSVELALKPHEVATGMMFRTNMLENEGMLFAFAQPHRTSFYMKNTIVPLSAAYIDPEGAIVEIHDLHPREERPVEASSDNIQYVLEVPQGWFKRHNISTGAVIRSQYGTLRQTFRFSR